MVGTPFLLLLLVVFVALWGAGRAQNADIDMIETIPCDETTLKANFPRDITIFENLFDDILVAIKSNADAMGSFAPKAPNFFATNFTHPASCSDPTCFVFTSGDSRVTKCATTAGTAFTDVEVNEQFVRLSSGPFGMSQLYNRFQESALYFYALMGSAPYVEVYYPKDARGAALCDQPAELRNPTSLQDPTISWLYNSRLPAKDAYLVPPAEEDGEKVVRACAPIVDYDSAGAAVHRYGVLCGGFLLEKLSTNLVTKKPSSNGDFILVSSDDYTILDGNGSIISTICGEGVSGCKLTDSAAFSEVAASIAAGIYTDIRVNADGKNYLIESSEKIRGIFYGIAIVPTTDFTIGASWSVDKPKMSFPYNSGDIQSKNTMVIQNTGLLPIMYSLDVSASTVYKVDKITGRIEPQTNETIEFRACVKEECAHHPVVITNVHPQFSMCYSPITVQMEKVLMDCSLQDMEVKFLPCEGLYHPVHFQFKEPKTCYGGILPPASQREFCEVISHSATMVLPVLVAAALASMTTFMLVVLILRQRRFASLVLRTRATFLYPVAIGLMLFGVGKFFLLFSNSPAPCVISWVLSHLGYSILAGGLMASCDFIIKEQIKKELVLEKEIVFLIKRLGPIFVVNLIVAFATTKNSEMVTYNFTYHTVFKSSINACGRDLIMNAVASIVPLLSLIYIMSEGLSILRSKCDPAYKRFARGNVIMSAMVFIYLLMTSFNIIPSYNGLAIMIMQLLCPAVVSIALYLLFPFNVWAKTGETLADQTAKTYGAILSDPITRTSLLAHMKDLVQDESLYFFEDVQKFQTICAEMNSADIKPYAKKIVDSYIREGSDQEINIDVKMRNEVILNLEKNCTIHLFDRAFNEITRLICHNCVSSFLVTPYAAQAKMIRDWFDGFEDFSIQFKRAVRRKILDYPIDGEESSSGKKESHSSGTANKLGLNFEKATHGSVFTQDEQEEAALKKKLRGSTTLDRMESVQHMQPTPTSPPHQN